VCFRQTTQTDIELLALACKFGQVNMVKKLLEWGFGINDLDWYDPLYYYFHYYGLHSFSSSLMVAIENNQHDVVCLLPLENHNKDKIIRTNTKTRIYRSSNGRSRLRCDPTVLSITVERGHVQTVQWLIDGRVFDISSTSRPDDPYCMEKEEFPTLLVWSILLCWRPCTKLFAEFGGVVGSSGPWLR
jgi:hypothetical protein